MKFLSIAFVATFFCAVAVTAAPSSSLSSDQSSLSESLLAVQSAFAESISFDEEAFGLVDEIKKIVEGAVKNVKCSLNVIEKVVKESDVNNKLKETVTNFVAAVKNVVENDVKECSKAEGLVGKLKCSLAIPVKLAKLFGEFISEVAKIDKDLAQKIIAEVRQQCPLKQADPFVMDDEFFVSTTLIDDDEEFGTFGIVGSITKKLKQLVNKIKCMLRVTGEVIGDGELKGVYIKFRDDVLAYLKNDVVQCIKTKGIFAKVQCTYKNTLKLNKMFQTFIKSVIQTNADMAMLIVLEVKSQCFSGEVPDETTTLAPSTTTTKKPTPPTTTTKKPAPPTTTTKKPAPPTTTTKKPAPPSTTTKKPAPPTTTTKKPNSSIDETP